MVQMVKGLTMKEYHAQYYVRNKLKMNHQCKQSTLKRADEIKAYQAEYKEKNRSKVRFCNAIWEAANKSRRDAYKREWYQRKKENGKKKREDADV